MEGPARHGSPTGRYWCLDLSDERYPVSVARAFVDEVLRGWGIGAPVREDVVLVVSELVANARQHAAGPREIGVDLDADRVRVEVTDTAAAAVPARRPARADRPGGHGLVVVERLSSRWGTDVRPCGKSVWAECPLRWSHPGPGRPRRGPDQPP